MVNPEKVWDEALSEQDRQTIDKLDAVGREMFAQLASDKDKKVFLERQRTYGSVVLSHQMIGKSWTALLSNWLGMELPNLPGHVVAQMLCTFKVQRMGRGFHEDNYVDLRNYAKFAEIMQRENL
jgi:hypothetical protein